MHKIISYIKSNKTTLLLLAVILIISGLAHGLNMFHYPYFEDDEGTYMSQAWSLITHGKLAPYTYWYDHAPMGWILIGIWTFLTGGVFAFGFSLNSGRVLMLVLHLLSTILLFGITKKLTKSNFAAFIASILFSLSPLGIYFQRRILLDNPMTFWVLLSFFLLLGEGKKLSHYVLSSICLGLAILSKEPAVFFLPPFLYIVYDSAHKHHRVVAVIKYLAVCIAIVSVYILFALLRNELFPSGSVLGGTSPHVSLLSTFKYQASRTGGFFLNVNSGFRMYLNYWIQKDWLLLLGGITSTLLNIFFAIKSKAYRYISLVTLFFWLFLIRGGEVIEFYITPFIPILSLSIAASVYKIIQISSKVIKPKIFTMLLYVTIIISLSYYYYSNPYFHNLYTQDQTTAQISAVKWIQKYVPSSAIIVIDNYAFIDLNKSIANTIYVPKGGQYYWKIDEDPAVKINILNDNWRKINYLLVTHQMEYDMTHAGLNLVNDAYNHSELLKRYPGDGWYVEIRKVDDTKNQIDRSWSYYSSNLIKQSGQIIDPQSGKITSEAQSYALLRAVWMNDKNTYDKVLNWTTSNLALSNNLFAWEYGKKQDGTMGILDKGTATDADEDIAFSLILASEKWNNSNYLSQARNIINGIWKYETVDIQGNRYLVAGDWASSSSNTSYTMNPSYIAPYAYRVFAKIDSKHDWNNLLNSSYQVLSDCTNNKLDTDGKGVLPPDWCSIDANNIVKSTGNVKGVTSNYSFDAMRVYWRLALDYTWYKDERDKKYIQSLAVLENQFQKDGKIFDCYSHVGVACSKSESLAQYGAILPALNLINSSIADNIVNKKVLPLWNDLGFWGTNTNYYDQNWVWFGKALYDNLLTK